MIRIEIKNYNLLEVADCKGYNLPEVADGKGYNLPGVADCKDYNLPEVADCKGYNLPEVADCKDYNLPEVADCKEAEDENGSAFFGCDQDWYNSPWQRRAGCGPTVFSAIICYINRKTAVSQEESPCLMKCDFVALMNEIWNYVTPSIRGIPTTTALCAGAARYLAAKGLPLILDDLKIPANVKPRPTFRSVLAFLTAGLSNDIPIAFLALDNGDEELLDSWHWVTLLAIEYEEDGSSAFADIIDEGKLLRVNLHKWFHTSLQGGGFVSFRPRTP